MRIENDFVLTMATANGSGSQSANNILVRALFRMGVPVGGKNLFPSNIQGLPTWFTIRAHPRGFTARRKLADVAVAMNPQTASEDLALVHPEGWVLLNSEIKLAAKPPSAVKVIAVPFKDLVAKISDSIRMRKLLVNMAYVGVLAELLEIPAEVMEQTVDHQFGAKGDVADTNKAALAAGRAFAASELRSLDFPYRAVAAATTGKRALIDGNTASAMGLLFGGCTVVAWYPITPSSSLIETFSELAQRHRVDASGRKSFAVVQAEDELASISVVIGAGWAGARAMTATSGPGLSLMAEAAGLAFYAEIPAVIWDIQRVGPSTGLPTRTMQGDLRAAYHLSHGDTRHVLLLPGTPAECFEFGQTAFDLAERLQTLVIVLSDLDTGMNLHATPWFEYPESPFQRGKVLDAEALGRLAKPFRRYADEDGDGIGYRTLPGTEHPHAAYFTRGTGHDEAGAYSEKPEVYRRNVERLAKKFETARGLVPKPVMDRQEGARVGLVLFGSSHEAVAEARAMLRERGVPTDCLRLRALPFTDEFEEFLRGHDRVYVIEQNHDGQLMAIVRAEWPALAGRCHSVLHYDGMPLDAATAMEQILAREAGLSEARK